MYTYIYKHLSLKIPKIFSTIWTMQKKSGIYIVNDTQILCKKTIINSNIQVNINIYINPADSYKTSK